MVAFIVTSLLLVGSAASVLAAESTAVQGLDGYIASDCIGSEGEKTGDASVFVEVNKDTFPPADIEYRLLRDGRPDRPITIPLSAGPQTVVKEFSYGPTGSDDGPEFVNGDVMLSYQGNVIDQDSFYLPECEQGVVRVSGTDRFKTNAELVNRLRPYEASDVFVASGYSFPDALAASPIAAQLGTPVLLTKPNALQGVSIDVLKYASPSEAFMVGGSSVVGSGVRDQLRNLVGMVDRISGTNRYKTAVALSQFEFTIGASTVYVVSGDNFPDALAAGAVAGRDSNPILLTRSTGHLNSDTAAEIRRLDPDNVVILGGDKAVSSTAQRDLEQIVGKRNVSRVNGANRYETALKLSASEYRPSTTDTVYLASGENFPDALAGGVEAAILRGPMLLTKGSRLSDGVADEIIRLKPDRVVTLGGTGAVSTTAQDQVRDAWFESRFGPTP